MTLNVIDLDLLLDVRPSLFLFERIEGLREAYRKTRTQKRGGKNHRRRLKGV